MARLLSLGSLFGETDSAFYSRALFSCRSPARSNWDGAPKQTATIRSTDDERFQGSREKKRVVPLGPLRGEIIHRDCVTAGRSDLGRVSNGRRRLINCQFFCPISTWTHSPHPSQARRVISGRSRDSCDSVRSAASVALSVARVTHGHRRRSDGVLISSSAVRTRELAPRRLRQRPRTQPTHAALHADYFTLVSKHTDATDGQKSTHTETIHLCTCAPGGARWLRGRLKISCKNM